MYKTKTLLTAAPYRIDIGDIEAHREIILEIWKTSGNNAPRADKLDAYYLKNPAGLPVIFLLWSDKDDRYVGVLCAAPRIFFSDSSKLVGMAFADLVVEPSHRTLGPSVMLLRQATDYSLDRVDFIYGFMNPSATFVGKRIGLTFRGPLQQLAFPISVQHHVQKRLKGLLGNLAGLALQLPFAALIFVVSGLFGLRYRKNQTCRQELTLDSAVLSTKRGGDIFGQRNKDFLEWRLESYPMERCSIFTVERDGSGLAGYIAYSFTENKRVQIEDLVAVDTAALVALIARFCREMIRHRKVSVQVTLLPECRESAVISKLGFRNSGSLTFFCEWATKHENTFARKPLYITSADNDV